MFNRLHSSIEKYIIKLCFFKCAIIGCLKRDIPKVESHRMAKTWKKISHAILIRRKISIDIEKNRIKPTVLIEIKKNSCMYLIL